LQCSGLIGDEFSGLVGFIVLRMHARDEMVQLPGGDVVFRLRPVFGVNLARPERDHPAIHQDAYILAGQSLQQPMA
jgi:hypothetical protein